MHFTRVIEYDLANGAFLVKGEYLVMQVLVLVARLELLLEEGLLWRRVFHLAFIECVQLVELVHLLSITTIITVLISACKPVSGFRRTVVHN